MILVGVDTSGKNGSLTLARTEADGATLRIIDTVVLTGGMFSAQLIPELAELVARHGFSKPDIGAFAVISGPGSFTGLRVGLAAVKGLGEALQKPIVPISLLEMIARKGSDRHVMAALDAGRNELYVGEYEDGVLIGDEQLVGRAAFVQCVALKVITPDIPLTEQLRQQQKAVELVEHPGSVGAVQLGWQTLREGRSVAPDQLDANYIRRSDAEIFAKS